MAIDKVTNVKDVYTALENEGICIFDFAVGSISPMLYMDEIAHEHKLRSMKDFDNCFANLSHHELASYLYEVGKDYTEEWGFNPDNLFFYIEKDQNGIVGKIVSVSKKDYQLFMDNEIDMENYLEWIAEDEKRISDFVLQCNANYDVEK